MQTYTTCKSRILHNQLFLLNNIDNLLLQTVMNRTEQCIIILQNLCLKQFCRSQQEWLSEVSLHANSLAIDFKLWPALPVLPHTSMRRVTEQFNSQKIPSVNAHIWLEDQGNKMLTQDGKQRRHD